MNGPAINLAAALPVHRRIVDAVVNQAAHQQPHDADHAQARPNSSSTASLSPHRVPLPGSAHPSPSSSRRDLSSSMRSRSSSRVSVQETLAVPSSVPTSIPRADGAGGSDAALSEFTHRHRNRSLQMHPERSSSVGAPSSPTHLSATAPSSPDRTSGGSFLGKELFIASSPNLTATEPSGTMAHNEPSVSTTTNGIDNDNGNIRDRSGYISLMASTATITANASPPKPARLASTFTDAKQPILAPPPLDTRKEPTFQQKLAFYLDTSRTGRLLELFDAILSLAQCALYVWNSTYVRPAAPLGASSASAMGVQAAADETSFAGAMAQMGLFSSSSSGAAEEVATTTAIPLPRLNLALELILASLLVIVFAFRLFVAPIRASFLTSTYALLTLLSSVPIYFAALFHAHLAQSYMSAGNLVYLYPARWARLHATIDMVFMPVQDPLFRISAIARKVISVTCAILFTLLTVAAFIHITLYREAKPGAPAPSFMDVFYFTIMSSTSGQNATIQADSWLTRALLLCIMIAGAFYIPTNLSELLAMVRSRSKFNKPHLSTASQSHVLVTGTFDGHSILEFLREFFCPDHGPSTVTTRVVMLNPNEPSEELVAVLHDPAYTSRVTYVLGTPTSFRSLDRAAARSAKAVFVLTAKDSSAAMAEDAETVMRALAIKKYHSPLRVFVESMLPENQAQFYYLADQILCIEELTMGILAQAVRVPGFPTLIALLSSSMTDESRRVLVQLAEKQGLKWIKPYIRGASQEMYACHFPRALVGMAFKDVSRVLFGRFGACLIGLSANAMRDDLPTSQQFHIVLNPAEYVLTGCEIGFLIASESEVVDEIMKFTGEAKEDDGDASDSDSDEDGEDGAEEEEEVDEGKPLLKKLAPGDDHDDDLITAPRVTVDVQDVDPTPHTSVSNMARMKLLTSSQVSLGPRTWSECDGLDATDTELDAEFDRPRRMEGLGTGALLHTAGDRVVVDDTSNFDLSALDPTIEDHIILCDTNPDTSLGALFDLFLHPLRDPLIADPVPVVILSLADAPPALARFQDVFHVHGNPLRRQDLLRAGIDRARKLVILSSAGAKPGSDPRSADAGSILCALNAESAELRRPFVVVQLHKENFKFIGQTEVLHGVQDPSAQCILRPSFMAGHVFSASLLDGLLAQTYYSGHVLSVIKRLIFTGRKSLVEKLRAHGSLPAQHTCVHSLPVPSRLIGRSYRDLYSHLAHQGMVPLGLYRKVAADKGPLCMTIINPRPKMVVKGEDMVLVLTNEAM
ncbi:hypothetical protein AMAG_11196 [Allomyces macrogynus ATCC 38327]|uniref:Uncharacterized protein n=1 Tax=Allomyces macrogynus (strain ATCC 38327) TaxID=578462 RepID=A0A0L0SWD0_ALLM3|nr:hypothetical protein AMAG_11196 [Allomyces macrogynus ATCC 38327]|eukprot:KNE66695.1 hypothetical protein AMAG_11196 [Allomyces macrogynus ATCC 38327]